MVRERQPRACVIGPLILEEERELATYWTAPMARLHFLVVRYPLRA